MSDLPQRIGPWRPLERLDEGGNGIVYRAEGPDGEVVALKVLKARNGEPYERFVREIQFLRQHQDVSGVLPLVAANLPEQPSKADPPWLAMSLATPIRVALRGLALQDVVEAIRQIAETLATLKQRSGIAHRDIKPGNLYESEGCWLTGDFGLVSIPGAEPLTGDGRQIGPANYVAWEMVDHPSTAVPGPADVYSLGKTLWVLATEQNWPPLGHQAVGAGNSIGEYRAHRNTALLDELVDRMTRHHPEERPTIEQVAADLAAWQSLDKEPAAFDLSDRRLAVRARLQDAFSEQQAAEQLRADYERAIRRLQELTKPLNDELKALFPAVHVDLATDELTANTVRSQLELSGQARVINRWHRCTKVTVTDDRGPGLRMSRSLELLSDGRLAFVWFVQAMKHGFLGGGAFSLGPVRDEAVAGSLEAEKMFDVQVAAMGEALKQAVDALVNALPEPT